MPRTEFHVGLSVRGFLIGSDRDCRKLFKHPDGKWFTPREAKEALAEQLAQGVEMLPFGSPCEGWSPKDGCPGHPAPEEGGSR